MKKILVLGTVLLVVALVSVLGLYVFATINANTVYEHVGEDEVIQWFTDYEFGENYYAVIDEDLRDGNDIGFVTYTPDREVEGVCWVNETYVANLYMSKNS